MQLEVLSPGVQHHQAADPGAQVSRRRRHLQQRLAHSTKQQVVEQPRVRLRDRRQLVWHREHHVKILDRQQFLSVALQPRRTLAPLALRAVPVATRVVQRRLGAACVAAMYAPAHLRRSASGQCGQHLAVGGRQPLPGILHKGGAVAADDLGYFRRRRVRATFSPRSCSSGSRSNAWMAACKWSRRTCV